MARTLAMPPAGRKRKKSANETKPTSGSEVDGTTVSSSASGGKRRRKESDRKLPVGSRVEVRQFEAGLRGSWHTGVVIGYENSSCIIEYENLLAEDGSEKLIESVCVSAILEGLNDLGNPNYYRGHIRPSSPVFSSREFELCYGLCVDAFVDDAWWEGVIFDHQECLEERLVFFPDQGDQHRINVTHLRITHDWDEVSGDWSCRGNWYFLELLENFVLEGSLPVSIRQIWYDLRTSVGFRHGILEWTCGERSLWSKLVLEAVQENMNAALGLACSPKEFAAKDLTIQNREEGREVTKLQSSACGEDTVKITRVCRQQRSIENILQDMQAFPHKLAFSSKLNVAAGKHAIDLRSTDDIVLHKDDLLSERITNASQVRGSSRDFQLAGGKDEKLQAVRRGNNGEWVSQKGARLGSVRHRLTSRQKGNLQTLSDFLVACGNDSLGQTRSKVLLEAKQLLLAAGWVFGTVGNDSHRFYYDSPGGQRFYSFAQACKAWQEEQEAEITQSIMDDHGDGAAADSISPSPSEDGGHEMWKIKGHWQPWGEQLQAKYSSQAVKDYCAIYLEKKRVSQSHKDSLVLNTKLHLLALGWRIDYKEYSVRVRNRYISPCGKSHFQLIKACMYLMQQDVDSGRTKNNHENVSEFHPKRDTISRVHCQHSWHSENLKLRKEEHFSILDPLGGSQDSRKAIREDEKVWSSANDHVFGEKVHHELSDLSLDPVQHIRLSAKEKLCEEQSSSAFDASSDNQDSTNDGRCMDASLSSTKMIVATEGGSNSDVQQDLSQQIPEEQQDSEGNCLPLCRENFMMQNDPQALTQCGKLGLMKRKHGKVQTVLTWLIDNNVVLAKQKVYFKNNEGHHVMAEGRISREGIKCMCCKKLYGLANFSVHAGGTIEKPAANIFLKNGKSLLQCQTQLVLSKKTKFWKPDQHRRVKGDHASCKTDNICSVCHYGGELILCDYCPSAFHFSCIGLKGVPEGMWSCPSCQCGMCGHGEYDGNVNQFTAETILYCDQCECQYHVGCLRKMGLPNLGSCPEGSWFCGESCSQIFVHLQKLIGKSKPTGVEGLSWTILRSRREGSHDVDIDTMVEHHSKLWVALSVLHECFQPCIEPHTKTDFFTNVVFNRRSELKRLNFQGFYTMVLEREDEVISVATVRIFGEKVAEIPLIGTRVQYRRLGMCRLLMNEIEKVLCNLGIKRLLLPAVPEMLATWINSFGFAKMTSSTRLKFLEFVFLDFEETVICEKQLLKCATTKTLESKEDKAQDGSCESNEAIDCDRFNNFSEVINPRLASDDTQEYLLNSEVGTCEESSVHSWDGNYCAGPMVCANDSGQINQSKVLQSLAINVDGTHGKNACGFARVTPPFDMDKKRTTLGVKSYQTRAVARQLEAKTTS